MLALTDRVGRAVIDADGTRVGRLADLGVRRRGQALVVSSLLVRPSRRAAAAVVPWGAVAAFEATEIELSARCDRLPAGPCRRPVPRP